MCGIAGWTKNINLENSYVSSLLNHRGPDQNGFFSDGVINLLHTRLSILDLSEFGMQPMFSKDRRFILVFNGEIFNHLELRGELQLHNYEFKSHSDTETLLYSLIHWGPSCLTRLNGIFAFGFYDIEKMYLIVARDQLGVKPLYYSTKDDNFIFSSELKVISQTLKSNDINIESLVNYITLLWSPGILTPESSINKLLPGHYLEIDLSSDKNNIKISRFYKIPFQGKYLNGTEEELVETLDLELTKSVERQLLSDVPVGFFLSGGLDSSLLVAIAKKITGNPVQCFTIDTKIDHDDIEGFSDDLPYANKVAQYLGVNLEIVKADVDIIRDFDKMIWHLDEPQADPAPLNVLNISRRAKELGFKVLIGGTGGDDLFTGYRRHKAIGIEKYLNILPKKVAKLAFLITLMPQSAIKRRLYKIVNLLKFSSQERMIRYFEWLPHETTKDLFTNYNKNKIKDFSPLNFFIEKLNDIPEEISLINRFLYLECNSFLVDHNLNYTDKMGMAEGVEIRVPYLDINLVNLSTKIPPGLKLKNGETKYILKKVAERYLPHEVIYRPKTGFGAPIRKWITSDMEQFIFERLNSDKLKSKGIFDSEKVWKLIHANKNGEIDASYSIWALLAIDSWVTQFIEQRNS